MSSPKKAGVIGWPITQSRSPSIHGTWLNELGIDGSYEKYAVEPNELPSFIENLQHNGVAGLNLTIPHREQVLSLVDEITDEVKTIGAANTLWFQDDKLIAGNTDGYGFLTHLQTSAPKWQATKPAVILGAGGAARAIIFALLQAGVPEIILTNRTQERADQLAKEFGNKLSTIAWQNKEEALIRCGLLVNSTSLGMTGKPALEINIETLPNQAVVYDIVYAPLETDLLKAARLKGLATVDGLGMLLHQAVPGFEKWFGTRPQVTQELYQKVVEDLNKPKAHS